MSLYCTVPQVKTRLASSKAAPNRNDYDTALYEYIELVSRRVDDAFYADRPLFAPFIETRRFPVESTNVDSSRRVFRFTGSLLELTAVDATGTALALNTVVSGYPDSTRPPFHALLLRDGGPISSWYENCSSTEYDVPAYVDITGVWGIHRRYSKAWRSVTTLGAAVSNTTALTFTAASVTQIGIGAIVKIDTEILNVTDVDEVSGVVTVFERGDNGSTAATHLNGAAVYVWDVDLPVRQAVARQVGLLLSRDGAYTTIEFTDAGAVRYPNDWLWEVMNVMERYAYDY